MNGNKILFDTNAVIYFINSSFDINNNVNIINLDENIKNETISIRKNFNIKIPDAIIITTSKVNNLSILTQDEGILKFNEKISVKIQRYY